MMDEVNIFLKEGEVQNITVFAFSLTATDGYYQTCAGVAIQFKLR
jgi:hypothetical protein